MNSEQIVKLNDTLVAVPATVEPSRPMHAMYPYDRGDFLILGPGIFTRHEDQTFIEYNGQTYVAFQMLERPTVAELARPAIEYTMDQTPLVRAARWVNRQYGALLIRLGL